MNIDEILEKLIYPAVDELLESEEYSGLGKSPDIALLGPGSAVDSLGLVNLIVLIEERIAEVADGDVRLVNERAMSRKKSPFRSISTLADYIAELLAEPAGV
jgi:acyl carrier protein